MSAQAKVTFVSFEAVPFAKVGGLADVAGALPKALVAQGVDCELIMPRYGDIDPESWDLKRLDIPEDWFVGIDFEHHSFSVWEGEIAPDCRVFMIGDDAHFGAKGIYQDENGDAFGNELKRLVFFCKGVVEFLKFRGEKRDVIHLNDYHTALVAPYLRQLYAHEELFQATKIVYSIHNMAYQGVFPRADLRLVGFEDADFSQGSPFEFHGAINLMKLGIEFADAVTTVSPQYAQEIRSPEFGCQLDGLLNYHASKLTGILNGVDVEIWNPEDDPLIPYHYDSKNLSGKRGCKAALLKRAEIDLGRLDLPTVGMVGRLVEQKGIDIVADAAEQILSRDLNLILLGSGEERLEHVFEELAKSRPHQVGACIGFDNELAHLITAGADIFLMPSRYEPCGLNQMYAMRYGTIPLVHRRGGLADTVKDWNAESGRGNGFAFDTPNTSALIGALDLALGAWRDPLQRKQIIHNAMEQDWSWAKSAAQYCDLYRGLRGESDAD